MFKISNQWDRFPVCMLLCLLLFSPAVSCTHIDPVTIAKIDMMKVRDGMYRGEYIIRPVIVAVDVIVKDHEIAGIDIIKHSCCLGGRAEVITKDVIRDQSLDVDSVSGATISSKCILKAIEDALLKGLAAGGAVE